VFTHLWIIQASNYDSTDYVQTGITSTPTAKLIDCVNDEFYSSDTPAVRTRERDFNAARGNGAIHNPARNGSPQFGAADFWPLIETIIRRWPWLVLGGMALGSVGILCGLVLWKSSYVAPAQLMRYNSPNSAEIFGYREAAAQTFVSLLRAPDLLREVGEKADPPISAESLAATLRVDGGNLALELSSALAPGGLGNKGTAKVYKTLSNQGADVYHPRAISEDDGRSPAATTTKTLAFYEALNSTADLATSISDRGVETADARAKARALASRLRSLPGRE